MKTQLRLIIALDFSALLFCIVFNGCGGKVKMIYGDPKFSSNERYVGIVGNALFLDKVIILDYKNQRFGIFE
jgi:hypothetical protein